MTGNAIAPEVLAEESERLRTLLKAVLLQSYERSGRQVAYDFLGADFTVPPEILDRSERLTLRCSSGPEGTKLWLEK